LGKEPIESRPVEEAEFEDECFDAVAMWDVLEHLVDPRGTLIRLHRLLKPGGYLGIATLNHASLMYVIYHALRWAFPPLARPFGPMLYNPFHTYYFTKPSLARLVHNVGFEIIEHRGYEFPISRLDVGLALKFGMRGLYLVQGMCRMQGEQYILAYKP
jgi:2-polyprenyl-3-methyl-5-hydroxy-6-metoxy-1,4-benzoquinol methylase